MPFTPSHAVVALPFVHSPLVPAAIAIGAMTPDLPLFVRGLPLHYGRTHAFEWLPVTVLLALALLLLWRCALRPAARELAPAWLAARLPAEWDGGAAAALRETLAISVTGPTSGRLRVSWGGILLLLLSLLVGVVSHIVWDLFTHEGRWGVTAVPGLGAQWGPLPGYTWLQHGSSIVGLTLIGVFLVAWLLRRGHIRPADPSSAPAQTRAGLGTVVRVLPEWARWAWWVSLPACLIAAWGWGLATYGPIQGEFTLAHLAYRVLPPACAAWAVLTLALCLVVQVRRRPRGSRRGAERAAATPPGERRS